MTEEHSSFIKTPKQLAVVIALAFLLPIALAVFVSQLVTSGEYGTHENADAVLARIQPVGTVVLAEASGPKGVMTGEQVFDATCKTCHETGLAGAPRSVTRRRGARSSRRVRTRRSDTRSTVCAGCLRAAATAT